MHDESVAYCGTEMSFRVEPQRMSTPVNVGAEDEENDPNAMLPIEEEMQCRKTKTCGEDEQVVLPKTVGKRKRESLEMDGSRMGMPSDGRVTRSVKRLKRLNTTAVRKGLRRNLSFTAMKSPFTSLLRRGRSSMMDRSTVSQVEMDDEDMPDCSFIEKSPTFKTPKILPSATNTNQAMVAAVASVAARGATMDGILSRSSLDDTNICLPEIEEEDGANFVVEPTEEGKRASTAAADPGVAFLILFLFRWAVMVGWTVAGGVCLISILLCVTDRRRAVRSSQVRRAEFQDICVESRLVLVHHSEWICGRDGLLVWRCELRLELTISGYAGSNYFHSSFRSTWRVSPIHPAMIAVAWFR